MQYPSIFCELSLGFLIFAIDKFCLEGLCEKRLLAFGPLVLCSGVFRLSTHVFDAGYYCWGQGQISAAKGQSKYMITSRARL